jgi:DNA polymerase-3 subunit epsilon
VELDARVLRSNDAFGIYRSERDAHRALEALAREHKWCLKLLGLESGPGSCFGLQVGRCKGACVGKEPALLHMARVKIGLMPVKLKPWPHEGPVMLREGAGERQQWHIVDAWQHLGSFDAGDEDAVATCDRATRRTIEDFDIDAYRIVMRFMRDSRHPPQPLPRS